MRILFVTRKFPPSVGGMEVFAEELVQALRQRCPDTRLFKPDPPIIGRPKLLVLLRFLVGASLHILHHARTVDVVLFGDAVLTPLAWIAKMAAGGNVVTVVTAHGNDMYYAHRRTIGATAYRVALKVFSRYADLLIANSADTRRAADRLGFRNKSTISLATRPALRIATSEPSNRSILFAGRLMPCKGMSWFVREVMPLVDPNVTLLVAGPPWDCEEMNAVAQCSRARYLGVLSRESLAELRSECIACIMPNLPAHLSGQNEGFGLSALESAAVGVPVIASNLGGLAEAVVNGVTGFLVEPMDAEGFAARINEVATWHPLRRQQFAQGARQTIAERFTWDRVADDYFKEFERLTARKQSDASVAR